MNPEYYGMHDMVFDGVDSFNGVKMYHCARCGKTDTQIYWEYWEIRRLKERLAELEGGPCRREIYSSS